MSSINSFIEKLSQGKILFFAGAGISLESNIPDTNRILANTFQFFLPKDKGLDEMKRHIIKIIQPEVLYEIILQVVGTTDALIFWQSISPIFLEKNNYLINPNTNHLFIVSYSYQFNLPIFTTNFDILFEMACKQLGYPYKIIAKNQQEIPKKSDFDNTLKVVYIFKLHGSIIDKNGKESLKDLSLTMNTISMVNIEILDYIQKLLEEKHLTFVGYSGRDIDYFPQLKNIYPEKESYWIDRDFSDDATNKNVEHFKANKIFQLPSKLFAVLKPHLYQMPEQVQKGLQNHIFCILNKEHLSIGKTIILSIREFVIKIM